MNSSNFPGGITYTFQGGPLAGATLTGGIPETHPTAGEGVHFPATAENHKAAKKVGQKLKKDQKVFARLATCPGMAELAQIYKDGQRRDQEEKKAAEQRTIDDLKAGRTLIEARYYDGEYLSGHSVAGHEADLLIELGLAHPVSGWGTLVNREVIDALGEKFTYAQAALLARPALEEKRRRETEAEQQRAAKFAEAQATGKPVKFAEWTDDCCERDFDCSLDIVTQYAMPDGSTKTERIHTH